MKTSPRFAVLAVLFNALLLGTAQAGSVFEVAKISVDVTAESTAKARAIGLRQGQAKALAVAMRRLAKQTEWGMLPQVTGADIEPLVEGFRISNEKTGNGRYLANMAVQFKPGPLRDLLRANGIAVTEVQSRPALLLPVLEDLQGLQAWGEHWWQQSWSAYDIDNSPAPMLLPLGDLEDTLIANAEDILIGDPEKLQALNQRYDTDTVVVAHALADIDGQLGVTAYIFAADENDVIVKTYRTGEAHPDMARRAIDEIMADLAERWKSIAAVASDEQQVLQVRAAYTGLSDWTQILDRLNEVNLVRDVTIVELTDRYAYVDIGYIGSRLQLASNLTQRNLRLGGTDEALQLANSETADALGVTAYQPPVEPAAEAGLPGDVAIEEPQDGAAAPAINPDDAEAVPAANGASQ